MASEAFTTFHNLLSSDGRMYNKIRIYTLFLYNNNCHVHIFYLDLSENERIVVDRLTQLGESNIIEWHLHEVNYEYRNRPE